MESLKLKMVNEIFFELSKHEIVYDSLYFSCSVLIDKDYIHFSKNIFEGMDGQVDPSIREGYAVQVSTQLLPTLDSLVVYFEILSTVRRIDLEVFRKDMLELIDKYLKKNLFFEVNINQDTTIYYFITDNIIYTNKSNFFPFGSAFPSEIDDFIYKYEFEKIKETVDPQFLIHVLYNLNTNTEAI